MPGKAKSSPKQAPQQAGLSRGQRRRRNRQRAREVGALAEGYRIARANVRAEQVQGPKAAMDLLHMLSLPHDVDPIRLPTRDMPKTEVLRLRQPDTLREAVEFLPSAKSFIAVYGHPSLSWAKRVYSPKPLQISLLTGSGTNGWRFSFRDVNQGNPRDFYVPMPVNRAIQTVEGVSKSIPIMVSGTKKYFYVPANSNVQFTTKVNTNAGAADCTAAVNFCLEHYRGLSYSCTSDVETVTPTSASIVTTWTSIYEGWYSAVFTGVNFFGDGPAVSFDHVIFESITVSFDAGTYWDMQHMETLESNRSIGRELRRTSAALLLTNTTSALSRQGAVVAGRVLRAPPGVMSETEISGTLNSAYDQYTGQGEKGVYTYMAFDDADEVFEECINTAGGLQISAEYLEAGYMNLITITNANMLSAPNTYLAACDMVVEFKGSSSLHKYLVPSGSFLDLVEMRRINNATAYFYENPLHWATLSKYLHSAWNMFRRNATKIGAATSVAFPEAAPVIMPVARALQI